MKKKIVLSIFTAFLLGGCGANNTYIKAPDLELETILQDMPQKDRISYLIHKGIDYIKSAKYEQANDVFSEGLRLSPDNSHLHFFNALAYHMQSLNGDSKMLDLAQTGYDTTLRFDDTNYWASYLLGNIYFKKQNYRKAQNHFAQGLLYDPKNPYLLRGLAVASYYCNDIALNSWAAKRAYEVDPDNIATLRNLIFAQAAAGDSKIAFRTLKRFIESLDNKKQRDANNYMRELSLELVSKRVNDWKDYYASNDYSVFGNDIGTGENSDQSMGSEDYSSDDTPTDTTITDSTKKTVKVGAKIDLPKMTLVDVVIIQTEELRAQAKGINLLDGLVATLGGTLYGRTEVTGTNATKSEIKFSPTFTFEGLQYNLNIFNDDNNKAEVLARPSLLAVDGKPSKFFSGSTLHVQLSSENADGTLDDIPIGIHLNVTPKFYGNDTLEVTVHAERAFLQSLSEKVNFTASSQTSQTSVDATAVLKFGETLILSGLSESANDSSKSGVPLLKDIPGVQYMFSRSEESEVRRSILILLTPRKPKYFNDILAYNEAEQLEDEANKKDTYYTRLLINKEKISATNTEAAISHFANDELYRQFRTGDLKLDDWNNQDTFMGSIKRMLGFLYY